MILSTSDKIYAFNIVTGKNIWSQKKDTLKIISKIFNDNDGYIYFINHEQNSGPKKINIFRSKYDILKWELVENIVDTANIFREGNSMTFSKNNKGEMLMILQNDISKNVDSLMSRVYCFNLANKTLEWVNDFYNRFIQWGLITSTNQNVFINWGSFSENFIASIDLKTGNLLWEKVTPLNRNVSFNFFVYNNNPIIVHNTFKSLSQTSGNALWETRFHNYLNSNSVFKNYVILSELSNLFVYDLENGNEVYYKKCALADFKIQGSVAINQNKRLLYFKDESFLNCFKIPEEIIY